MEVKPVGWKNLSGGVLVSFVQALLRAVPVGTLESVRLLYGSEVLVHTKSNIP